MNQPLKNKRGIKIQHEKHNAEQTKQNTKMFARPSGFKSLRLSV